MATYSPSLDSFLVTCARAMADAHTFGLRKGQAAFVALSDCRPEIAEVLIGTKADPFGVDDNLDAFFDRVVQLWNSTPGY